MALAGSRPFSDRPAGMINLVSIPMDIRFDVGDIEPLVCTLALYYLPVDKMKIDACYGKGKISEDFVFPAGNWRDLLREKAGKTLARSLGSGDYIPNNDDNEENKNGVEFKNSKEEDMQHVQPKIQKALFSYDPMRLLSLPDSSNENIPLYLVMEVHKVTQTNAGQSYIQANVNTSKKNTFGEMVSSSSSKKKLISGRLFGGSNRKSKSNNVFDERFAESKAKNAFDLLGTQFLTQVCFGIIPIYPEARHIDTNSRSNEKMQWPNGMLQKMQFYGYTDKPISQKDFEDKLTILAKIPINQEIVIDKSSTMAQTANDRVDANNKHDIYNKTTQSFSSSDSTNDVPSFGEYTTHNSNVCTSRSKPSKERKKKSFLPSLLEKQEKLNNNVDSDCIVVNGTASFFTSNVGVDFTQSLLQTPKIFGTENNGMERKDRIPRLLVDLTGDCAIMINPKSSEVLIKKRSDLIRLPPSTEPSGYSDSSEVREVLYLPPNYHKNYEAYIPMSSSTHLNLLYLYPCLIMIAPTDKEEGKQQKQTFLKGGSYSVRVRLVQQGIENEVETICTPLNCIYNPAPGGNPLLQALYTKIPSSATFKSSVIDMRKGLPLRDEVKIRLPNILDGTYFIQFSLFSINFTDGDKAVQNFIAETLIPLSSSTTKESKSGVRVTTIIPNGMHRIKLGSFQLQVETRLASSIHITDPAVACVVRDFPLADNCENKTSIALIRTILSNASAESVVNHFQTLMYIHLHSLVSRNSPDFNFYSKNTPPSDSLCIMVDYMKCLFEVLNKVKKKFRLAKTEMNKFLKNYLDVFDEANLSSHNEYLLKSSSSRLSESSSSSSLDQLMVERPADLDEIDINDTRTSSLLKSAADEQDQVKPLRYIVPHKNIRRNYSTREKTALTFSRKAYGASKFDRMKAEAELYEDGQMTQHFDDDETVITTATFQSQMHRNPNINSLTATLDNDGKLKDIANEARQKNLSNESNKPDPANTPLQKARLMAKRVNTVAQVFIAPCVAPSNFNQIGTSLSKTSKGTKSKKETISSLVSVVLHIKYKHFINCFTSSVKCFKKKLLIF